MLEAAGKRILIDCGMRQGNEDDNATLPFSPESIDCVLITHAHIDHSGRLPLLAKNGFKDRIIATGATCRLLEIMLLDSAHIQEADYKISVRKSRRAGVEQPGPLFETRDAKKAIKLLTCCNYHEDIKLGDGISARFTDAGHLLGSAYIKIAIKENGIARTFVFSGDIGNKNKPIIKDPQEISGADYVIMESTYGNRLHKETADSAKQLAEIFNLTFKRGGNVVIPSFSVGRTQELLYIIREIKEKGLVKSEPDFSVYVDSPLALEAVSIYSTLMRDYGDEETIALLRRGIDPISFPNLRFSRTAQDSMRLNTDMQPKVIISSSGMCEAGRIRHHLKHNLWRPECSVVFTGYQSNGTLGRILLDGAKRVKLFGEHIAVKAGIFNFAYMSGHADKNGLLEWISKFEPKPRRVFVVHGEQDESLSFAEALKAAGFDAVCPEPGAVYDLADDVLLSTVPAPAAAAVPEGAAAYEELRVLGQRLLEIINRSNALSTNEQNRFAKQIEELVDFWENKAG